MFEPRGAIYNEGFCGTGRYVNGAVLPSGDITGWTQNDPFNWGARHNSLHPTREGWAALAAAAQPLVQSALGGATGQNQPPVARFSATRLAGAGNRVLLDGRGSADPDGSITSWTWSVGGAQIATGATATVQLGAGASKVVTLRVTDNRGAGTAVSSTVLLPNRPPRITAASPANGAVAGSTTPTLAATGSDDDADSLTTSYRVTGPSVDLSSGWVGGAWTVPPHRLDPGVTYTWTVTVKDPAGATAALTRTFTVAMLPTAADVVATPSGAGYWQVDTFGHVFSYGDARYYGGLEDAGVHVSNVMGMARTPSGQGYWLVGRDGGVFAFGDAGFYGSMARRSLNGHITGMSATPTGRGYWLTGCDGGIFAFGDAAFHGSNPSDQCRGT